MTGSGSLKAGRWRLQHRQRSRERLHCLLAESTHRKEAAPPPAKRYTSEDVPIRPVEPICSREEKMHLHTQQKNKHTASQTRRSPILQPASSGRPGSTSLFTRQPLIKLVYIQSSVPTLVCDVLEDKMKRL